MCHLSQGFFEILIPAQDLLTQEATQSQGANVSAGNSSFCWQFGEISTQEPFLPAKVNRGSATMYSSGLIGIQLHWAV